MYIKRLYKSTANLFQSLVNNPLLFYYILTVFSGYFIPFFTYSSAVYNPIQTCEREDFTSIFTLFFVVLSYLLRAVYSITGQSRTVFQAFSHDFLKENSQTSLPDFLSEIEWNFSFTPVERLTFSRFLKSASQTTSPTKLSFSILQNHVSAALPCPKIKGACSIFFCFHISDVL